MHAKRTQMGAVLSNGTQHAAIDGNLREGKAHERGADAPQALDDIGGGEAGGAMEEEGTHACTARAHQLGLFQKVGAVLWVLQVHVHSVDHGFVWRSPTSSVIPPVAYRQPMPHPFELLRSRLVLILRGAPVQSER